LIYALKNFFDTNYNVKKSLRLIFIYKFLKLKNLN